MSDIAPPLDQRRDAWSRYWQQDVLHSLPGSFAGNYDGAIERHWQQVFAPLGPKDRVLDLGTGNGALPQLLCTQHAGAMPRVDAIDLAAIAPDWLHQQPQDCRQALHFHGGTTAEALPFEDASFTLITSQYGIEYCDTQRSLPELARVLAPAGRVALLLHHAESRLTEVAREEHHLTGLLLAPDGFLDRLQQIVPWLALATTPDGRARLQGNADANQARAAFNQGMQALQAEAKTSPVPDLLDDARQFASQALARLSGQPASDVLTHIRAWRTSLEDARLRYAELCACALDADQAAGFAQALDALGLRGVTFHPIAHDNGMLMGWVLNAAKPA